MPDRLEFSLNQESPAIFLWNLNIYSVCPECIRLYQERQCNGITITTHRICEHHSEICSSPTFDSGPLEAVRESFAAGDIQQALCNLSSSELWPYPHLTYTHTPGCLYSSSPAYKIIDPATILTDDQQRRQTLSMISQPGSRDPATQQPLSRTARHTLVSNLTTAISSSRALKAIYFLRCDGAWVNGVNEAYPNEQSDDSIRRRETLVRLGIVDAEDLALTSWAFAEQRARRLRETKAADDKKKKGELISFD